ncbi:hypothetical protein C8F04DRAFT_706175 [Mycena alexandri]|uniref:Uncharacterized protein n=1 Tax=Mycena alexandri TaxID=1745969 RepID=A0AAD6SPE5_9AGAR|nr:hypothetical protein C8F04DRAFT_706175 [Mycena alexandri]
MSCYWIASYFRNDPFLSFTQEDAIRGAERDAAWLRFYNDNYHCLSDRAVGCNTADALANWPRFTDTLMEDVGLQSQHSGHMWTRWTVLSLAAGNGHRKSFVFCCEKERTSTQNQRRRRRHYRRLYLVDTRV